MSSQQLALVLDVASVEPADKKGLEVDKLQALYEDVRKVYKADSRPWVIGFSGGKDSTVTLQIVWCALSQLPREELTKPVHVISSDTLVESPVVAHYILGIHDKIDKAANAKGLPIRATMVYPKVQESFWVLMIGKGYPAPYTGFRWCTDRLKIQPANRFIMEQVAHYGEVVLVLGVRRAESAARAQVMSGHKRIDQRLSRHSDLRNAWVYTPIEDFTTNEVWDYLLSVRSPWGANNQDLVTMYRNAQAGECPLVVDASTPSCGNSRFGCWTCTVVDRDRSMEALIDNGEEWMEPLLELRDWLSLTQDPATKEKYRNVRRRDGKVHYWGDNREKLIWGPYKFEVRKEILRRLLEAQKAARLRGPDPCLELIREEELHEIRRLWTVEEGDWGDSLAAIYREVMGEDLEWIHEDRAVLGKLEFDLLRECAEEKSVSPAMLRELLDLERRYHGMSRRSSIYDRIESILNKDWMTDEEVFATLRARREEADGEGELEDAAESTLS